MEGKSIAIRLAAAAIVFFIIGFALTVMLLVMTMAPRPQDLPMTTETAIQFLLAIIMFETASAIPCTIISFVILMD